MATCQSLNCLAATFQEEAHHRLDSDGACSGHYSSLFSRGPAETETSKALVSLNQVKVGGEYTLKSPVSLLWLVGTGAAFYPSPWPSASKWSSISAFVKAINRAVQA